MRTDEDTVDVASREDINDNHRGGHRIESIGIRGQRVNYERSTSPYTFWGEMSNTLMLSVEVSSYTPTESLNRTRPGSGSKGRGVCIPG